MVGTVAELCEAVHRGDFSVAAELIKAYPSRISGTDKHGNTILHAAVAKGSLPLVRLIIGLVTDLDLDARNREGLRPLQLATAQA